MILSQKILLGVDRSDRAFGMDFLISHPAKTSKQVVGINEIKPRNQNLHAPDFPYDFSLDVTSNSVPKRLKTRLSGLLQSYLCNSSRVIVPSSGPLGAGMSDSPFARFAGFGNMVSLICCFQLVLGQAVEVR